MQRSGAVARASRWRDKNLQLSALLIVAMIIGGGGVAYGLMNLAVMLMALLVLAMNREAVTRFWTNTSTALRLLVAATLLLPALQLVPMPETLWQALPGRELAVEARDVVGISGWFPLSLAPHRTMVALVGLIVPLTVLFVSWRCGASALRTARWVVIGVGVANFLLGIVQVMGQGRLGLLYPENPMPDVLFGFFANRNTAGLFLVACLCLLANEIFDRRRARSFWLCIGIAILLALGVVLTQSRSAIALTIIPILLAVFRAGGLRLIMRRKAAIAVFTMAILVAIGIGAQSSSRLDSVAARFNQTEDARFHIWQDAAFSAQRYWPVGAGMGTFDEVFQADESLEHIGVLRAGRAHNDYLEVAIEAGVLGLALVFAWLALIAVWSWQARLSPHRWSAWSGSAICLAIALQSILDFPLRNQAMLALAALALLLVMSGTREMQE